MTAQAADRKVTRLGGELYKRTIPVAATTRIWSGSLVMHNAAGAAVPAASGTGTLVVAGIAEEQVDNLTGASGDLEVVVESDVTVNLVNDGTAPVTQAHVGTVVYAVDDQTISSSSDSAARPAVGILHELRGTVPYVHIPKPGRRLV